MGSLCTKRDSVVVDEVFVEVDMPNGFKTGTDFEVISQINPRYKHQDSPVICCGGYNSSCDGRVGQMSSEDDGSSSECGSDNFEADNGSDVEYNHDAE